VTSPYDVLHRRNDVDVLLGNTDLNRSIEKVRFLRRFWGKFCLNLQCELGSERCRQHVPSIRRKNLFSARCKNLERRPVWIHST